MLRCLCCNKEITNPTSYESEVRWHGKCIRSFFGTDTVPELDSSEKELERIANSAVNKGLTVPGVQKKLSLHLSGDDRSAKLTIVDYPTGYILKPQSEEYESLPETEYLVMKMAEISGINTVPNALILFGAGHSYITKRVDRPGGKMLAMEDFCQLSGRPTSEKYHSSYENCGKVIKAFSKNVGLDITEFYYRLLFCFVTGNSDMHLKNFSLMESAPASRIFGLSPAYDMLPVNILIPSDHEQTALSLNGKKNNIRKKDFKALSDNLGIPENAAQNMMNRIIKYKSEYIKEINEAYISEEMKRKMIELIETRTEIIS